MSLRVVRRGRPRLRVAERVDVVLRPMRRDGVITDENYDIAKSAGMHFAGVMLDPAMRLVIRCSSLCAASMPECDRAVRLRLLVKVATIVLPEVPASSLLSDPATACFAAGSDAEGRSNEALCAQVASALRAREASWPERHMAVVAAAMRGRYESMVTAMEQASLEPVIIEDLVKFGEDRGYDRGYERGRLEEERATLRRVLALRKLGLKADGEARIDACTDLATLQRWHDQAVLAASADEALQ
jgi:hypothetical protein